MRGRVAIVLLLVIAMGLGLAACGDSAEEASPPTTDVATTQTTGATAGPATSATTSATTAAPSDEVIKITFAHFFPAGHPVDVRHQEWAQALAEATNGRVEIVFHQAQSLLTAPETYEGVVNGIADMGLVVASYSPGLFPLTELFDLPVEYNDCQVITHVLWDCFNKFQPEEFSKVKVLSAYAIGPGGIATREPVASLEDLKDMQIRAVGLSASYMSALGASPVSIAMPEAYEALSRGVCDGAINAWDAFVTWKLIEVTDYITMTPFMYVGPFFMVMNQDTWNSLPSDIQAAFASVSEDFIDYHAQIEAENALKSIGAILDAGKEIIVLSEEEEARWKAAVQPAIDAAIAEREAKGLPAQAYYDEMVRLAEQYNGTYPSLQDAYLEMAQ